MPKKAMFVIPYPNTKGGRAQWSKRFGLNAYYAGKAWPVRKADADYWHKLVWAELERQKVPRKVFTEPVSIQFWFNDRLDIDNDAIYAKLTIDALKGWLIQDDSKKYVRRVELNCHDEQCILVVVTKE